jgi:hypothetical protein
MRNEGLIKNYTAQGAVPAYRIAKFGSVDGSVVAAAAATDLLIGISGRVPADASGDRVDIVRSGIAEVEYGGAVTRGQPLTSDASGKAVAASPAELVQTAIAGGAAGNFTVTGIAATDTLVSVIQIDATDVSETVAVLTAEFAVTAANTINNADGTATTGSRLLVTYRKPGNRIIGHAEVSGVSGDIGSCLIAPGQI